MSMQLKKITSYNGIKFPKSMPPNHILSMILTPPSSKDFYPQQVDGLEVAPKISLKDQDLLRRTCKILNIDPVSKLGMPHLPSCTAERQMIERLATELPLKQARKEEKWKKISENMSQMPDRIRKWKEDKLKAKNSAKPALPF